MEHFFYLTIIGILLCILLYKHKAVSKYREEIKELDTFLSQIPGGIFAYTADEEEELGIISEGLWKLFEYDSEKEFRHAVHNHFSEMVYEEDRAQTLSSIDAQVEHNTQDKVEYRIVTKNGKIRWVYDCGHLAEDSMKRKTFYVSILDNTELKDTQESLKQAESVSNAKGEFLSRVSHEIRTPMNGIIGMTTIAQQNLGNTEKLTSCLDKISMASEHLLQLINDVLDMSKIESGKIELHHEEFDFKHWIDSIKSLFSIQAEQKQIHFSIILNGSAPAVLLGDSLHLNQIIYNLLSNAFKFTPENGQVTLTITALPFEEGEQWITFSVADSGIGIAEENFDKIFESFEQESENIAPEYGGTGLGLPISRKLSELMGGTLTLKSCPGKGSVFTVSLPFTPGKKIEQDVEHDYADFNGKRVMIVDDNELNREIAVELLSVTGASIETAKNGKEALELFLHSTPDYYDLILMDIQMPVMNGFEATLAIRASKRKDASTVPVFAMTANAFSKDIQKSLESGMNAHISKPVNAKQIYSAWTKYKTENPA